MPSVEQALQQHATALRSLARALVGTGDADDVLQETAMQALLRPPVRSGGLGGWLTAVVRHMASNQRRAAGRRAAHERRVTLPEPERTPAQAAAHRDVLRALMAALTGLPEPYQATLMLRFFEDREPAAIARICGVPLATVKSRLQRGLHMLREQLDKDRDGDWRAGLLGAFGVERASTTAEATTSTGVLLMATATKVAILTVAVGICAWWLVRQETPMRQPVATDARANPGSVAASPLAATDVPTADTAPQRVSATPVANGQPAAIVGRCVDGDGMPLANCMVRVQEAGVSAAAAHSDADGRFTLPCQPHADGIQLCATADGRRSAAVDYAGIRAGQTIETGDLVLDRVREAHLRTVDGNGQPVAHAWLCFFGRPMVRTDATGSVTVQLRTGSNWVRATPPATIMELVVPDGDDPWQAVVPLTDESARIEGIVVDDSGAPVPGARIEAATIEPPPGTDCLGWSSADGTFALARVPQWNDAMCSVSVTAPGFEPASLPSIAWGARTLRIEMQRGLLAELHVRTADGRPVERFALWLRARPHWGARAQQISGTFPDGKALIPGARRGAAQVSVQPADGGLATRVFMPVRLSDDATRIDVVLPPLATRQLLLQYEDGTPLAGAKFELLHPVGDRRPIEASWAGRLEGDLFGFDVGGELDGSYPPAVLLLDGETDAEGRAELRGPPDVELALRLENKFVDRVSLGESGQLRIDLPLAGRVRGSLGPPLLVQRLGAGARSPGSQRAAPLLVFLSTSESRVTCAVDEDGNFEADDVPAGNLRVSILHAALGDDPCDLGAVTVQPGATAVCRFDVPELVPAELRTTVTLDGQPVTKADLTLWSADDNSPQSRGRIVRGELGENGMATLTAMAGTYKVYLAPAPVAGVSYGTFELAEPITVPAGGALAQAFPFTSGTCRLRIVDSSGLPVVGMNLLARRQGGRELAVGPTVEDGYITLRVPPGTWQLQIWRRDLQNENARAAFHGNKPTEEQVSQARFDLGAVDLPASKVVEREIRLPPAWNR